MFSKRIRPPDIDLARVRDAPAPKIHVQSDTDLTLSDDDDLETLQLSDSDSSDSSPGHRSGSLLKINPADDDIPLPDDITKDLAALQQLRKSVKTNLRLRPIRSRSNLPKINLDINSAIPSPFAVSKGSDDAPLSAVSPALSAYYTPISETPHSSKHRTPFSHFPPLPGNIARPISPKALHDRLRAPSRPLLIDTRPLAVYQAFHLRYSVNIAIPSLILKRYRKSGAGLEALDTLRQFTTTEQSRARWDALMSSGEGWDGNAVIYDGEMDVKDKDDLAWAIIPIVAPLLGAGGSIEYLEGGLSATRYNPDLEPFIVTADGVEVEPIGTGTPQHATLFPLKNRSTPLSSPLPPLPGNISSPISANTLYNRLRAPSRPLLIDTRPLAAHQAFHLRYSVSIAIPSLILKRCRKPGGGLPALSALRQFVTTEQGKERWDELMGPEGGWDGNVVIYDDEMDVKDKDILGVTAWAIMPVIAPLLRVDGRIEYLEDGLSKAGHDPDLTTLIVTSDEADIESSRTDTPQSGGFAKKNNGGLFQLDTHMAFKFKKLPEIEPSSSTASNPPSPPAPHLPPSPLPMMPSTSHPPSVPPHSASVADSTPSPPPSSIGFRRPAPPRRPSVPGLRRLDTRSAERLNPSLPKLSVRTKPMRSATLHLPPSLNLNIGPPQSPSHLQLMYSTHSPPLSARFMSPSSDPSNYLTPYYTPPHTPGTPRGFPPSPSTARPDLDPPTTEEAFPMFAVSTILPNFLYLGPELTTPEHVAELKELGVKRILNIAAECDDDMGLGLKEAFKYCKIPMRDTVEEDGIAKGVREACDFIDDARLHSAPTYVHCKAGKSRSVTAVMAYLIHANHWTLSRAYAFVLERRKGISPNIGFVSELMNFEEQELGGKSVGVQPTSAVGSAVPASGSSAPSGTGAAGAARPGESTMQHSQTTVHEAYAIASNGTSRRGAHVRESLPPVGTDASLALGGPMSAGGVMDVRDRVNGDSGQEMEIKDASGRYRHARRAPVDETTLQPMRRVSKAGLESSSYV